MAPDGGTTGTDSRWNSTASSAWVIVRKISTATTTTANNDNRFETSSATTRVDVELRVVYVSDIVDRALSAFPLSTLTRTPVPTGPCRVRDLSLTRVDPRRRLHGAEIHNRDPPLRTLTNEQTQSVKEQAEPTKTDNWHRNIQSGE
jgi:hypothetical protein